MKYHLITGVNGFIGSNLALAAIRDGRQVIGIIPPWEKPQFWLLSELKGCIEVVSSPDHVLVPLREGLSVFVIGDITDISFVNNLYKNCYEGGYPLDCVIHLAACAIVQHADENHQKAWQTNFIGTKNMLDATVAYSETAFPLFVHASTDKVYGEGSDRPYDENDALAPVYVYDKSKAAADSLVFNYHNAYNLPATVLRFANVYGPGDLHKLRLIPGTLYNLLHTKRPPHLKLYRDETGETLNFKRDLIYIDDIVDAILTVVENRDIVVCEPFNFGTEKCHSVGDVIHLMQKITGNSQPPEISIVNNELREQCMSFQKARRALGFYPKTSLKDGLQKAIEWYSREDLFYEWID